MQWKYTFENYTSGLDRQPPQVAPGRFVEVWGADGRYEGALRRFPGFISYEGLPPGNLGRSLAANDFDPDLVEYFEINKELGSDILYRGWLIADRSTGELEMWYKSSNDADGVIAKKTFSETYKALGTGTSSGAFAVTGHATGGVHSGNGNGPLATEGVMAMVSGKVGDLPTALYVASSDLSHAGARNISIHGPGIAMHINGRWKPTGTGPPFGPAANNQVTGLAIFQGKLYASLSVSTPYLTNTGTTSPLWVFDGREWAQIDLSSIGVISINGLHVFASRLYMDSGTDTPYLDSNLALQAGPTGLGTYLDSEVWGFTDDGTNLIAYGEAQAGQLPVAYCTSSTNWGAVGAGTNSPSTGSISNCSIVNGTTLHVFSTTGTTLTHRSRPVASIGSSTTWTLHATDSSAAGNFIKTALIRSSTEMILGGSFDELFGVSSPGALRWQSVSSYTAVTGLELSSNAYVISLYSDGTTVYVGGRLPFTTTTTSWALPVNGTFSTSTRGPYLYVFMSNGNHKVIYYDQDSADFVAKRLGPGAVSLPGPVVGTPASGGNAVAGQHLYLNRYVDTRRQRYTAVSNIEFASSTLTIGQQVPLTDSLGSASCLDLEGFDRVHILRTVSSGSATVAAGGSIYRAGTFTFGSQGNYAINMHLEPTADRGNGNADSGLADSQLPTEADRLYNFTREFVAEADEAYASAYYQRTNFILSPRDGFLELRWSSTFREEPENFPPLNAFSTKIPVDQALTCRLLEAGDFLYLLGGTYVYRIQRSGAVTIVVEVHRGIPILHRNGMVRVAGRIYVATELGLLELDGRTGNVQEVPNTHRIFYDRWRGSIIAGDASNSVRMGYDARMGCIFMLHPTLKECLCFWLATGKTTMLAYLPYANIVTGTDLNDKVTERSYFLTKRRWFASCNWDHASGVPQTMNGEFLLQASTVTPYNMTVKSVVGNTVTFEGTPFAYNGSTVTDFTPCYCAILTGASKHRIVDATAPTASSIVLFDEDNSALGIVAGDVIAFAPIVFGVIGSNLWGPRGHADTTTRRSIKSFGVTPARVKTFPLGSATPPGDSAMLWFGAMRHDDVIANEPRTSYLNALVQPRSEKDSPGGTPLDVDQVHKNTVFLNHVDGPQLYPFVFCLQSNINLELHELTLTGEYTSKDRPGPGT